MSSVSDRRVGTLVASGAPVRGRTKYLVGASCIFICTVMLLPLGRLGAGVDEIDRRSRRGPADLFPASFSLDSYVRLWNYQAGLPIYFSNSFARRS